jgi:chromosome segregation protein
MRLESVEIVGFKSFCDKQEVDFKGGVTGIVGPNGCGKSNISDAISWVLGEQSAKSLRGGSMEDVIFNGSQARQPVGMAEVNLKVSGLNGHSPDGSGEAIVSRRLYRNGESEYLMNGQTCRLRDVHELFMDTGLGSKAYSIIEQGKIGMILSSKPADRRALIEEAAGITKYRARRRQTQLKLEATQQNLLRVNDIVHEVEKQLESLKRQASKARRYRQMRDESQDVERVAYGRRFVDLDGQAHALRERFDVEHQQEQTVTQALEAEEAGMEARRTVLHEHEGQLEQVRARLGELARSVDRHQAKSGYSRQQIAETDARAQQTRADAADLNGRVGPLGETLVAQREDTQRVRTELEQAGQEAGAAEAAVQTAVQRQSAAEREQDVQRDTQVALLQRLATLANSRESTSATAERAAGDLLKLASENAELEREREQVLAQRGAATGKREEFDALLAALGQQRVDAERRAAEARTQAGAQTLEAETLQSECAGVTGRLASLEEIVATHAAFDEGVRALLQNSELGLLGVVADSVETDSAHERALEAFLGDRLQALLAPDTERALAGIRFLQQSTSGRGTFLPLRNARTRNECTALQAVAEQEPDFVKGLLSSLYRVSGPHAAQIRAALPDALVVETIEDAFALQAKHGPVACVTLQGETLRGALVEGGRTVKGLLAPRREIKEAAEQKARLEVALAAARAAAAEAVARAEQAEGEARELLARGHAAEKDLVAVRHALQSAEEELQRMQRKATVLDIERSQAEQERAAAGARLAEIEAALGVAQTERDLGAQRLQELATAVGEARALAETAQAGWAESRSRLAALREKSAAAETEVRRLEQDLRDLEQRSAAAAQRAQELDARGIELAEELAECERLLVDARAQREQVSSEVVLAEERVREVRTELDGREAQLKERRRERETLRTALSEIEVARARCDSDLDHLARECHQAVGQTAAEAATTLTDEDRARDLEGLAAQVQELRERLDKMGPVNVLAVEQAQEHEERYAFLTAQRQDLLDSIAELDRAIRTIDKTSRERFQEAFQAINQHFGEIFRQLFGGGTAGLSLIDEEDILESGIDVMAQPPGKRLQSVMLLSGGEKALTAISLLFAIFQYKPSPFCILDEVDAPLDEANVGRFVRMLEGLKAATQFILITHHRKTMEIADQLYGVTMEEPGVSKLVSVRFA